MDVLLALNDPAPAEVVERIRRHLPTANAAVAADSHELASLLERGPYEIVVVSDAIATGLNDETVHRLTCSFVIRVVDTPWVEERGYADDFIVRRAQTEPFLHELVARIVQARRFLNASTTRGEARDLDLVLERAGRFSERHYVGVVTASGDLISRIDGVHQVVGSIGAIRTGPVPGQAADALRDLRAMAETAPLGILVTNSKLEVEYANPAYYRRFSVPPSQVASRALSDIEPSGMADSVADAARRACETSALQSKEVRLPHGGVSLDSYQCVCRPVIGADGALLGSLIVFRPSGEDSAAAERSGTTEPRRPAREVLIQAVTAVQDETHAHVAVSPPDLPQVELDPGTGRLVEQVAHDLLEFALFSTNGTEARLSVSRDEAALRMDVSATRPPRESVTTPDTVRLRALINRSEELRSIVVRRDGRWDVERGSQGVAFHVCIPYHPEARTPRAEEQPQPFDLNSFMAAYGDSPEIMREILRLYRDEAPARLSSIDEGIEEGDYGRVAKAAHSLANTSGTLQSKQAVQAARALENAAREAKPDECRSHASRLVQIVNGIVRQINSALEEAS